MTKTRVRFAPSPTGPLHIGGVRTALYNYLFAKKNQGDLILRIEDTDTQRFVPGAEKYITDSFEWLGITFDEGPHVGGDYGPYRQSERKDIYKKYADILLKENKAYIAFDTPEELELKRKEIPNFQYDASTRMMMKNSLNLSKQETEELISKGEPYVIRFKIEPNEDIIVHDVIRGDVTINSSVLDDKVIYKSVDQLPTYHLANIVDDHLMKITQVIRGEEWLPSAPLHVLIYRAFGWEESMPKLAHLPLLLKPDGKGKLSKRDGDRLGFPVFPLEWTDPVTGNISSGYKEDGYLPDALNNFLALLGWNPGTEQELMDMSELISLFSLDRCSKNGAKFDYKKGKWFNHQYIVKSPLKELATLFSPILKEKCIQKSEKEIEQIIELVRDRVYLTTEFWSQSSFFFIAPEKYDEKVVKKRWKTETPLQMKELIMLLDGLSDFSASNQEKEVKKWIEDKGYNLGGVMNAFRLAIVGESNGPNLFDITHIIGKEETIKRLQAAIDNIKQ